VHSPAKIRVAAPATYPLQSEVNQKINKYRKIPSTGVLDNISPLLKQNQSLTDKKSFHFTDSRQNVSQYGTNINKLSS
jgi:hypothetical protein